MPELDKFSHLNIDWNLSPEQAVTLYLEWGNNDWHAEHPPVRSKEDVAHYFVLDNWGDEPVVRLVRRNSEQAEDLATLRLPQELLPQVKEELAGLRGISMPPEFVKDWLKQELYGK